MSRHPTATQGRAIIGFDVAATLLFAVTAVYAAAVFDTTAQWIGAVTAMLLFSVGIATFLWSFWLALQRSRREELSVADVYLLMGDATPTAVTIKMNLLIGAQFGIGLATSIWRSSGQNGAPGSSLVVGLLVPMLGFGLNGMWATRYGRFAKRHRPNTAVSDSPPVSTTSHSEIRQNAHHG